MSYIIQICFYLLNNHNVELIDESYCMNNIYISTLLVYIVIIKVKNNRNQVKIQLNDLYQ